MLNYLNELGKCLKEVDPDQWRLFLRVNCVNETDYPWKNASTVSKKEFQFKVSEEIWTIKSRMGSIS